MFLEEVNFFQLGQEALNQIRKDENITELKKVRLPKNRFRRHLWATIEYPDYSVTAKIVNILSLLMILISTIALAVESLPQYINSDDLVCYNSSVNGSSNANETVQVSNESENICTNYLTSPFFIIQTICVVFFTVELILRIISAPSFVDFVKNIMNWIDIAVIVPYYITLGIYLADRNNQINTATADGLRFLRILRFTRVLKFYRVFRNVKSLRALVATIRESLPDFFIMINILTLLSFLFGAAAYFAENDANGQAFDSIPKATYWGIITIASVGYGDIAPITPAGRAIACLCGLCGATTIGMLVSVLVDRYQRVFARKLYINEDIVDFHDFSDDENNDADSRGGSFLFHRRSSAKEIANPDTRAKFNSELEKNDKHTKSRNNISSRSDIEVINENPLNQHNSGVDFIIGYADNEKHRNSLDLLKTISSVVAQKQSSGNNIELSSISKGKQQSSPHTVKFGISFSSNEDTDDDDDDDDGDDDDGDDDDNEELTEIVAGRGKRGNVLRKFGCPASPKIEKQLNDAANHV
ncbi:unnamed protein product [Rotaria sp. Silwood2]|nr:unnamed protein product [Rotaria sp. Silwood2]